jgi:hypothetical protein
MKKPNDTRESIPSVDINAYLAERRMIAAIWCIEDVQTVRPDLTDDNAWEVLQAVDAKKDAGLGITWITIEFFAHGLFPKTDPDE